MGSGVNALDLSCLGSHAFSPLA